MGTKKEEVKEIEILTEEQIAALPDSVKENVVFLTDNLPNKELIQLNPLVSELLSLKDRGNKLRLEKTEDGEFKKESIEEYKGVKADQRSFNSQLKKTAKAIKDPINKIRAGVIEIEKTFKAESDQIKEDFEEKFKEYEDIRAEKARIAQEKKDAAMNAEIEKANKEVEEQRLKHRKMEIYNDIRNGKINAEITDKTADAVDDYSEEALLNFQTKLSQKSWEDIIPEDINELNDEVVEELKATFEKSKERAAKSIAKKLDQFQEDKLKLRQEAIKDHSPSEPEPLPPVPKLEPVDLKRTTKSEFVKKVLFRIEALEIAVDIRIKQEGISDELKKLKERFVKFNS